MATKSGDGTARIWPVDPLPLARARLPRDLTPAERQRFGPGAGVERAAPPAVPGKRDAGVWNQGLADHFVRQMQDRPADLPAWSRAALVSLAAGDATSYRRICGRVVETFLRNGDANLVNSAVWICAVGPEAVKDFEPLVREQTRVLGPQPNPDLLNTLGALLYRVRRFKDAVKRLEEAIARRDKVGTVHDWLFLAMAHQRLGHGDEARKWLEKSGRAVEQAEGALWDQRLELDLLKREAEALLKPPPAEVPPKK